MNRECQHGPRELALKAAFRRLIDAAGGVATAAASVRVSHVMLSNYGHPNTDSFAPIDVVLVLEDMTGRPLVTETMRRLAEVGQDDPAPMPGVAAMMGAQASLAARFGAALAEIGGALADGAISASELRGIRTALGDLHAATGEALTMAERQ